MAIALVHCNLPLAHHWTSINTNWRVASQILYFIEFAEPTQTFLSMANILRMTNVTPIQNIGDPVSFLAAVRCQDDKCF
jgi:hypothetical protein